MNLLFLAIFKYRDGRWYAWIRDWSGATEKNQQIEYIRRSDKGIISRVLKSTEVLGVRPSSVRWLVSLDRILRRVEIILKHSMANGHRFSSFRGKMTKVHFWLAIIRGWAEEFNPIFTSDKARVFGIHHFSFLHSYLTRAERNKHSYWLSACKFVSSSFIIR